MYNLNRRPWAWYAALMWAMIPCVNQADKVAIPPAAVVVQKDKTVMTQPEVTKWQRVKNFARWATTRAENFTLNVCHLTVGVPEYIFWYWLAMVYKLSYIGRARAKWCRRVGKYALWPFGHPLPLYKAPTMEPSYSDLAWYLPGGFFTSVIHGLIAFILAFAVPYFPIYFVADQFGKHPQSIPLAGLSVVIGCMITWPMALKELQMARVAQY